MISEGLPEYSNSGAIVGKWQTKVKALKMETSAMGGDSHVWMLIMRSI
jgi:N-methylhydantoinase A/oxoprolinase/acetone carboxylase beta subunit